MQKTPSPSPAFIKENINILRTMIKEHDQQAKVKPTPRRLAYADSNKEAPASKSQSTPSKSKEPAYLRRSRRLKDRSTTNENARRERSKPRGKRSGHQETSSDFEYEEGLEDTYEDLNSPYKRPKPTPFTQIITRFKYHQRAKLLQNIRVYEGNKDPEDHFGIFSAATEQEVWPMPVCFEELSQKFLEEFLQQNRYAKNPTEIHGIKRRQNEGLQAFMDRFKSKSSHIKGVPLVLRILAFMHVYGHPKLAKKLNEKIPKTVDEMFDRVRAFIRGEVAAGSAEIVRPSQGDKRYIRPSWFGGPKKARNRGGLRETRRNMGIYTPYPRKDIFTPLIKTPKEILAMESVSFLNPLPLIRTPEIQNLNKFCDYHGDKGHNTNDCYQLKKQIEEVVASGKLAHLVKDIRRNNQKNESQGRNMIREGENRKRPFKEERFGLTDELTFPAIPQNQLTDEPIILEGVIAGKQKMQSSAGRFLKRNVSSSRNNRPSSNYGKGRKKQNGANGVRDNKMSFSTQCHNWKDRNEKP
ncbi:hypothetical protein Tco_0163047 [Tanacetum coccineum]